MPNYSVLIVDDEPIQRKILQDYCSQIGFFGQIDTAEDAIKAMKMLAEKAYDLLLLDINLPVLSGLGLAKSLGQQTKVVFVTAYSEHAVAAFDLDALDYLLKPVSFERFAKTIQKLHLALHPAVKEELPDSDVISIKQGNKIFKLKPSEILYVEAKGNFSRIFLSDNDSIDTYMSLSQLLDMLPMANFVRVHRSFFVNWAQVTAFQKNAVYFSSIQIPIGESYKKEIEKRIANI